MRFYKSRFFKPTLIALSLAILVAIWWIAAIIIDTPYILPLPSDVVVALGKLIITGDFWASIGTSFLNIYTGFLAGVAIGFAVGVLTWYSRAVDIILSPVFSIIRTMPVACFIILAWTILGGGALPFFISLLMVSTVMMTATQTGLRATSPTLLETANVYHLSRWKKIRTCYLPAATPHIVTAIVNCIGLAWKAGIAAEIIVHIDGTIGASIWEAKSWDSDAANLFAWTITIILISLGLEMLFKYVAKKFKKEATA